MKPNQCRPETFSTDLADRARIGQETGLLAARVGGRLRNAGLSGRTVTVKIRHHDFTTITRSVTRDQPTDDPRLIAHLVRGMVNDVDTSAGIRLLGVGVTTLTEFAQDDLFTAANLTEAAANTSDAETPSPTEHEAGPQPDAATWRPGQDVHHEMYGAGWVWGSGLGRVTMRFEGPTTAPGLIHTFAVDDVQLRLAEPSDWTAGPV